jgi:hypothetical protein
MYIYALKVLTLYFDSIYSSQPTSQPYVLFIRVSYHLLYNLLASVLFLILMFDTYMTKNYYSNKSHRKSFVPLFETICSSMMALVSRAATALGYGLLAYTSVQVAQFLYFNFSPSSLPSIWQETSPLQAYLQNLGPDNRCNRRSRRGMGA